MMRAHSSRRIGINRIAVIAVKVILKGTPNLLKVNIISFGLVVISSRLQAKIVIMIFRVTKRPCKKPSWQAIIPRPYVTPRINGPISGRERAASG